MLTEAMFRDLLTPAQARKILDVSPSRVHQYAEEGRLRYIVTPLGRLYRRDDVERLARWREARRKERAA